ncbi:uncharacterized protein DEA37_0008213 [Paragonimus westermani]|uniref:Uncharacterized protein n=1 Tax=Paragonimus westermani TaxID=34504 RepID=A0A5J4NGL1_9TREM|nr:uncharacterized protein DEA37_0008213 [Paragonimus westermani]
MSTDAINIMLTELRHLYLHLPKDARTLLGITHTSKSGTFGGRHYVHFGLKKVRDSVFRIHVHCGAMELLIHVDGVSLFKSSRAQLWSLLGSLNNPETVVFIVGVSSGQMKPVNVSVYFQDLID